MTYVTREQMEHDLKRLNSMAKVHQGMMLEQSDFDGITDDEQERLRTLPDRIADAYSGRLNRYGTHE